MRTSVVYLIDRMSEGGGAEYVRRQMDARPENRCKVFESEKHECTVVNVNRWGADEIVVNHLRALLQLLGNPFRHPQGRVSFIVHGLHLRKYDFLPKTFGNRVKRFLRRRLEAWLYHRCERIVALTPTDAADIRRIYGEDLKVEIEPHSLDGWSASDMRSTFKGERFEYIFIGRFDFPKGQDIWLRHLAAHPAAGRTLFIGDGATLPECRRFVREHGLGDRVVFAGAIPNAERYLACARHVVSTSRWEGMPYLLMKAVRCGCDIIATDCPGNRDVLKGYSKWTVFRDGQASSQPH